MKNVRKTKKNRNVILRVAVVALSVYMLVSIGITLSEVAAKRKELAEIESETAEIQALNAALEEQKGNSSAHLEQEARENGMAKPGESVFLEIAND